MATKLQKAKRLFEEEKYMESKQLILEILNSSDQSRTDKLLSKLGDISIELREYEEARMYYEQSIKLNPSNPLIYIKIGNLFHEYLNDYDSAQSMYNKCILLDPLNEECWFNFGKLLFKMNDFKKASKCYNKCLTERACINYHHSLLLIKENKENEAKILLERAIKLKPNITKYHYQNALCLQHLNFYKDANKEFKISLKLSKYKDIKILYDYSMFLTKCLSDFDEAFVYLQKAMDLDTNNENLQIETEYERIKEIIDTEREEKQEEIEIIKITHDPSIKLIIYTLNETVTYWHIDKIINANKNKLKCMRTVDIIKHIFGGIDRLNRLIAHFRRITSSNYDIKLAIISDDVSMAINILKRVNIIDYFDNNIIEKNDNLLQSMNELANKYNLRLSENILFVENDSNHINILANHCKTHHVHSPFILNGLSLNDMNEIEQLLNVCPPDLPLSHHSNINEYRKSLKEMNHSIYTSIKKEIASMNIELDGIDTLSVIQWMHENWRDERNKDLFIEFARKYKQIRICFTKKRWWMMLNLMPRLIELEPNDNELITRFAVCLSRTGHVDEAEKYFKMALQHNTLYSTLLEYAFYLNEMGRYHESEKYYKQCEMNDVCMIKNKQKVYLGLARNYEGLQQFDKADNHYKMAIKYKTSYVSYFKYGVFLFDRKRYKESEVKLKIALKRFSKNKRTLNHYYLSKCLLKLKKYEEYEYHLKKTLELEPDFVDAQNDYNMYYENKKDEIDEISENHNEYYGISENATNATSENDNNVSVECVEFDKFWFDELSILNDRFNAYYDGFLENNMHDIRCILFDNNIEEKLKTVIGIQSTEDLKLIITKIYRLQIKYKAFMKVLKDNNLDEYNVIFEHHGIYNIESLSDQINKAGGIEKLVKLYNECGINSVGCNINDNDLQLIEGLLHNLQCES